MKYRIVLLEQLKSLPFFDKKAVRELCEPFGQKWSTVDAYITQSIRRKDILSLRKGLYVTSDFYGTHRDDTSYVFYLANVIRKPSYVSSWTALQYYNLTTEIVRITTSVTSKVTRDYQTKVGAFRYQSIKSQLFNGYVLEKGAFDFYIATPSKALYDLIYFRTRQLRGISNKQVGQLIDELRIDVDEMPEEEKVEFNRLIETHKTNE